MRFVEIKTPKPAFGRIGNSRRRANGWGPWRSSPPMKLVATSRPYAGDAGCGLPGRPDGYVADRTGQQARERSPVESRIGRAGNGFQWIPLRNRSDAQSFILLGSGVICGGTPP